MLHLHCQRWFLQRHMLTSCYKILLSLFIEHEAKMYLSLCEVRVSPRGEDSNLVFKTMTSNPVGSYECHRPCIVSAFRGRRFTMKIVAVLKVLP
jgi:hypothetical protein